MSALGKPTNAQALTLARLMRQRNPVSTSIVYDLARSPDWWHVTFRDDPSGAVTFECVIATDGSVSS